MINKSANINVRIEPEIKQQAEAVLSELGIPVSFAINQFYRQIILQKGLPFDTKLPPKPRGLAEMSDEEIKESLERAMEDYREGRVMTVDEAFDEILKGHR